MKLNIAKCWSFCLVVALGWGGVIHLTNASGLIGLCTGLMIGYLSMTWAISKWPIY
jgi:hypothetical protein